MGFRQVQGKFNLLEIIKAESGHTAWFRKPLKTTNFQKLETTIIKYISFKNPFSLNIALTQKQDKNLD